MKKMMKMPAMAYVILLLSMTAGVACNRDDGPKEDKEPEEHTYYYEVYPLNGKRYKWENLDYDDKLIVVNSYAELENYIVGTDYPVIDFSQNTLLLISGGATVSIQEVVVDFVKDSDDEYIFNVSVLIPVAAATFPEQWMLAKIVPVVVNEEQIKLNIQHIESGI